MMVCPFLDPIGKLNIDLDIYSGEAIEAADDSYSGKFW